MTAAHPFPPIQTRVELDTAPGSRWVECVSCVEHNFLRAGDDPVAWADEHTASFPWHTRYRVVSQKNFGTTP